MALIDPKRAAVNAVLPEALRMGLTNKSPWPTSNTRVQWHFSVDGGKQVSLFYISQPFGGGLGPQDRVAVFVDVDEYGQGGLAEKCARDKLLSADIGQVSVAVLLRWATDAERESGGGLRAAMTLLEPNDVGTDGCCFRIVGITSLFNFAG